MHICAKDHAASAQFTVAHFEFFAGTAWAGIVAANACKEIGWQRLALRVKAGNDLYIASLCRGDVSDVCNFFSTRLHLFGCLLQLLAGLHLDRHQGLGDFIFDAVEQLPEQLKGFALVFLLGLLLSITAQMNALAQIVERA